MPLLIETPQGTLDCITVESVKGWIFCFKRTWRILHVPTQTHTFHKITYLDITIFRSSECPNPLSTVLHITANIYNHMKPFTYHSSSSTPLLLLTNANSIPAGWLSSSLFSLAGQRMMVFDGEWNKKADFKPTSPIFITTASTLVPTSPESLC